LRATIWGCRGSLAAPGPETVAYGGNTSCVELELADGSVVVLDAGTGIRALGLEMAKRPPAPVHLCLTHLHLDHLEGLGFFLPLWTQGAELHIWGPASAIESLENRVARYMSPPLFPVQLSEVPSQITFHDVGDEEWQLGSARVLAEAVAHRGPTVGYRFEEGDVSLAYIPDHEPYLGEDDPASLDPAWLSGYGVAREATVLMHDAQYFDEEYAERMGWGHSSVAHAVEFARASRVGELVLFHHDPLHTDADLRRLEAHARRQWPSADPAPRLAREGMQLELGADADDDLSGPAVSGFEPSLTPP
jgi:ribonuclease BN (tRNA processing enzyme)